MDNPVLMFRTSPGPLARAVACTRTAVQPTAPGWHLNLDCKYLALERVVLWRAEGGLSLLTPCPWNQQSFTVDFTGSRMKFKLPQCILKLPPGSHQHTSVWQGIGYDMHFPAYSLSSGEVFTYTCICIITYIDLWKVTISLVSSSCYSQAIAIVIPQASWQLM